MEGMSKLTETSSLVLSDFKRINQGLPVLFLLQTTYHSYTKHYWPAHFLCVCSYSFSDTVIFWMEAYFSLARYVQYILYNGCRWFRRCIGCEFMILLLLLGFFFSFPVYTCLWFQHSPEFLLLFSKTLLLTEEMMFSCHGLLWARGPPKLLQSRSFCSIAAPIVGIYQRQSAYLNRWLPLSPMTWLAVCQQCCRGFAELV